PEGGLTRDGTLRPAKIGLLDYMLGAAREDPSLARRLTIIPVAINYDRVLEDRTLLREQARQQGEPSTSRLTQLREVTRYIGWNLGRLATGRWKRYGRAAVTFGTPVRVAPWLEEQRRGGRDLWSLPKADRLARVQALADDVMARIGQLVPVTPVPLACAAIQSHEGDFIPRDALLRRMAEMRDALVELNARVLRADRSIEETFDRAYRMLAMRRILVAEGSGFAVMSRQRPLVSYYANSIAHLLGPFAEGVRE